MTVTLMTDYVDEVDSSFIEKVGFYVTKRDPDVGNVFVQMNNKVYRYDGVPFESYRDLAEAYSVGHEYQDFAATYGPSDQIVEDGDLEEMDPAFRITVGTEATPEPEVSEDQMTFEDVPVVTEAEEGVKEDGGLWDTIQGDLLTLNYGTSSSEQMARETALGMAVTLLAGRKNVNSSLAIEYAQEFEDYLTNG